MTLFLDLNISQWILLNILVFVILSLFLISQRRTIFSSLNGLCEDIRDFIVKNDSFFTLAFLALFFLEQLALIILVFYFEYKNINALQILISIFALIVVTTSSLQKTILDVRVKHFKEQTIMGQKLTFLLERWFKRGLEKK